MKKQIVLLTAACSLVSFGTVRETPSVAHAVEVQPKAVHARIEGLIPTEVVPLNLEVKAPVTRWEVLEVPSGASTFKAQESFRALSNRNSVQWEMQQKAWTDADGFRRFGKEGHYMVIWLQWEVTMHRNAVLF